MRRRLWLVAVLLAGAATPVVGASAACAGTGDRAALVVDTGENTFSYCVSLSDDSVSGLELIELANDQHGLQYRFGDGGQAVCVLANVGAQGDDCFGEYPDFWGFWRGDGRGGWTWSSVGAGSTLVRDGDIQGWSWGSGQDGSTHPQPPPTRYADVCKPIAAPPNETKNNESPKQKPDRSAPTSTGPTTEEAGTDAASAGTRQRKAGGRTEEPPQKSDVPKERMTPRTATESARPPGAVATATETTEGPPVTALAALALIAALGIGGTLAMRRRRT